MKSFLTFLEKAAEIEARQAAFDRHKKTAKQGDEQLGMADKKRKEEERQKRIEELKRRMRMKGIEYNEDDLM